MCQRFLELLRLSEAVCADAGECQRTQDSFGHGAPGEYRARSWARAPSASAVAGSAKSRMAVMIASWSR